MYNCHALPAHGTHGRLSEVNAVPASRRRQWRMALYRIRFVNHADHVFGTEEMECASDREAVEKARRIHRHGIGNGYEIWQDGRLVHVEKGR